MPTYTIFGATGNTGGTMIDHLLASEEKNITINLYVRSKSKLLTQRPNLASDPNVHIFEGPITSIPVIKASLTPTPNAILVALGANENTPGIRINQDAAHAIVAALTQLKFADPSFKAPKIVILSSATLNPAMAAPPPAHWLLMRAFYHVYTDLILAEEFLHMHEEWLDVTFCTPGGLVEDDTEYGHELSLDVAAGFVGYKDLGAGMLQIAREGRYEWKGVAVLPKTGKPKFEWQAPRRFARGLVWYFAPVVAWPLQWVGLF